MTTKYQIIILGSENTFSKRILETFFTHTKELGLDDNSFSILDSSSFKDEYKSNAPSFCMYFGDINGIFKDLDKVNVLLINSVIILPVVNDLSLFSNQIPSSLRFINGCKLSEDIDVERIVAIILESFGLLRISRKIFISYKRDESSSIAIQLYETLEKNGFDVFLDTHSIRQGEPFQEELWHRMTDCDVILILNTPKFMDSGWCKEELAEASSKSIGILQLIWPFHSLENTAKLSVPFILKSNDFVNETFDDSLISRLLQETVDRIIYQIESLRARSLASRQNNLISEFFAAARKLNLDTSLQPERIITQNLQNGKERVFIPTVGIPQSLTYNRSAELIKDIRSNNVESIYLLYDHRSIRDKWLNHLTWLDKYLRIKTTKIVGIEKWLKNN